MSRTTFESARWVLSYRRAIGWIASFPAGILLVLAGGAKLLDSGATGAVMARVGVPVPLVDATLAALPGLEVGIGLILVAGFISRPALWAAIALYLGFTAFLVVVWLNAGKDATCGCFGSFLGVWAEAGMVPAIVRNGLAVAGRAAALLVLRRQPRKGTVPHAVPCVPSA